MKTLFVVLLMPLVSLAASPKQYPLDETKCEFNGKKFSVIITGLAAIDDPANDYGGGQFIYISANKEKILVAQSGKKKTWAVNFIEEKKSLCEKTLAVASGDKVLIFLRNDNRPHQDKLIAVAYDPAANKVLKFADVGVSEKHAIYGDKLFFNFIVPRSDLASSELKYLGQAITVNEDDLNAYSSISFADGNFAIEDDPKESFENFKYKKFFKNLEEFKTLAGWDETKKRFKNVVPYQGFLFDQAKKTYTYCINLTTKRGGNMNPKNTRCYVEKQ